MDFNDDVDLDKKRRCVELSGFSDCNKILNARRCHFPHWRSSQHSFWNIEVSWTERDLKWLLKFFNCAHNFTTAHCTFKVVLH